MGEASIKRGEKWTKKVAEAKFLGESTDWFYTQKSIVEDMKEYSDSLPKQEETKSKKGK